MKEMWQQIYPEIAPLLAAVIAGFLGYIGKAILRKLNMENNAALAKLVQDAAENAAGMAYNVALKNPGGLATAEGREAALQAGAQYVAQSVPKAIAALQLDPAHVANMVEARMGKLLAADPTVSAGRPGG